MILQMLKELTGKSHVIKCLSGERFWSIKKKKEEKEIPEDFYEYVGMSILHNLSCSVVMFLNYGMDNLAHYLRDVSL